MKKIVSLILIASLSVFAGCKSTSGGGDPKEVLTNFFEALTKKDIEGAKKYVTKDSEGMLDMVKMGMASVPDSASKMYSKDNMEIGNTVINGDKATVAVKEKQTGESTDFVLKKEDGNWKVAFDKSTLMDMAKQKMNEKGINSGMMDSLDINRSMDALKNMSKEDMENTKKMMDSAAAMLKKMKDNGQLDQGQKMMDSAPRILDKLKSQQ